MALETSVLKSVKKVLGLGADYTAFDQDIMLHINGAIVVAKQLGVPVPAGFQVDADSVNWEDLDLTDDELGLIKTFLYLKVRLLFDPPATSFAISAAENQLKEYEWRLNAIHEATVPLPLEEIV